MGKERGTHSWRDCECEVRQIYVLALFSTMFLAVRCHIVEYQKASFNSLFAMKFSQLTYVGANRSELTGNEIRSVKVIELVSVESSMSSSFNLFLTPLA